jgi:hypothetical protein
MRLALSTPTSWGGSLSSGTSGKVATEPVEYNLTTETWGRTIPASAGVRRLPGAYIWAKVNRNLEQREYLDGTGAEALSETEYLYNSYADVAVSFGYVADTAATTSLTTLYMDGVQVSLNKITYTFYNGQQTIADPDIVADKGAANTPAFKGQAYIVIKNLDLSKFSNKFPAISAVLTDTGGGTTTLEWSMTKRATLLGELTSSDFTFVNMTPTYSGFMVWENSDLKSHLQNDGLLFGFDFFESGGKIKVARKVDGSTYTTDRTLTAPDLLDLGRGQAFELMRGDEQDIPSVVHCNYVDESVEYRMSRQRARRVRHPTPSINSTNTSDLTTTVIMTASQALTAAARAMFRMDVGRTSISFRLPQRHIDVEPADILALPTIGTKVFTVKVQEATLREDLSLDINASVLLTDEDLSLTGQVGDGLETGTSNISPAVGTASGVGTATGVAYVPGASVGTASGAGTATGEGSATVDAAGTASGIGSVAGVGASTAASDGTASGAGTASGVGAVGATETVGTASGAGSATATGASTFAAAGTATGAGSVVGVSLAADPHRYWRIDVDAVQSGTIVSIAGIQMRESAFGQNVCVGGTASARASFAGFGPAEAFTWDFVDSGASSSTQEMWADNASGAWIAYDFGAGNAKDIKVIDLWCREQSASRGQMVKSFTVKYSDDGSSWTTKWSVTNEAAWGSREHRKYLATGYSAPSYSGSPHGSHRGWAIMATELAASTTNVVVGELQFRASPGVSQTSTSGTATANTEFSSSFLASFAFANDGGTTSWASSSANQFPGYEGRLWFYHDTARECAQLAITARGDITPIGQEPRKFQLFWSDDNTNWTHAADFTDSGSTSWSSGETRTFTDPNYV